MFSHHPKQVRLMAVKVQRPALEDRVKKGPDARTQTKITPQSLLLPRKLQGAQLLPLLSLSSPGAFKTPI